MLSRTAVTHSNDQWNDPKCKHVMKHIYTPNISLTRDVEKLQLKLQMTISNLSLFGYCMGFSAKRAALVLFRETIKPACFR